MLALPEQGEPRTLVEATGFIADVAPLPGTDALVYAAIRPMSKLFPPFLAMEWVVESPRRKKTSFREIGG